jgi:hypothetical protein
MKILNLYTAEDEETISAAFMKKIKNHLGENRRDRKLSAVLFDCQGFHHPNYFSF